MRTQKKTPLVQVLQKAVHILNALAASSRDLSLSEIQAEVDLPRATVHRILVTLELEGVVSQDPESGRYYLNGTAISWAARAIARSDLRSAARGPLERLAEETGESAYVAALVNGSKLIYVDKIERRRPLTFINEIGSEAPFHSTALGKALLAFIDPQKLKEIIDTIDFQRFTPNTITDRSAFLEELEKIRREGVAFDREEYEQGLCCLAVPVLDHTGWAVGAISISGLSLRFTEDRLPELVKAIKACGREVCRSLGGCIPGEVGGP